MIYSNKKILSSDFTFNDVTVPVYTFQTVVIGSGAAGLSAASALLCMNHKDIALITESMKSGASKNTGANNQTYYKLSEKTDSVRNMAQDLYNGASMDGDVALTQAAYSSRCFYRLADLGMEFSKNIYGEFAEYGNPERITDAGFFTSKKISEALEKDILDKNITVFNRFRIISIINNNETAVGFLAIDKDMQKIYAEQIKEYNLQTRLQNANKNVFGKIQERLNSVKSKNGKTIKSEKSINSAENQTAPEKPPGNEFGYVLFQASNIIYAVGGPAGIYENGYHLYPDNMTCSLGAAFLAGVKGKNLTETVFENAYISKKSEENKFKWKIGGDLLSVSPLSYISSQNGNIIMDFRGEPCKRLIESNPKLYNLFLDNGTDLAIEPIEITSCAYHLNGGLECDNFSESNIKHFFPVGEAAAVFGVSVPEGASLAATQITSFRAAEKIAKYYSDVNPEKMDPQDFKTASAKEVIKYIAVARHLLKNAVKNIVSENISETRKKYQKRFSECCMAKRSLKEITSAVADCRFDMSNFINENKIDDISYLSDVLENHDILITQYVFLQAVRNYIMAGGKSRGSYVILNNTESEPVDFDRLVSFIQIKNANTLEIDFSIREVNDIPAL